MKPQEIETKSFEIIDEEAGEHRYSSDEWTIVRRIIHTTADFEYKESTQFHSKAIESGLSAIHSGKNIITDTKMALSGLRKRDLDKFNVKSHCFITHEKTVAIAKENQSTRASAAVDVALSYMEDGIYAVGNAPTALLRLMDLIKQGKTKPALVLGFPVGFVNAAESKAELIKMDIPFISNIGRKGGSNVVASVINALTILALKQ